jgi:hypothetical protein
MAGLEQHSIDRTKMTTNNMYDGLPDGEDFSANRYSYFDGAAGISFNSQLNDNPESNFFAGLAYHHFHQPGNSFYRNGNIELQPKWVASGGVRLAVTPESYLTLQGDITKQGPYREVIGGALYGIKLMAYDLDKPKYTIHGGAFLRWNDAFIPVIKLDYHPFSIALSYDVNVSPLKTSSQGRGGFELGISYIGFTNRNNTTLNAMLCPKF